MQILCNLNKVGRSKLLFCNAFYLSGLSFTGTSTLLACKYRIHIEEGSLYNSLYNLGNTIHYLRDSVFLEDF